MYSYLCDIIEASSCYEFNNNGKKCKSANISDCSLVHVLLWTVLEQFYACALTNI